MEGALAAIGIVLIMATLIPVSKKDVWWVRVFDFPRAQILLALIVTLAAFLFVTTSPGPGAVALIVALSASILFQGYMTYPYTLLSSRQVEPSEKPRPNATVSLLFANVLMTNRDAGRLKQIVREADPDVVLAIETDVWWHDQLRELETRYPYTVFRPQDNTYGMLLFSRLPLEAPQVKFLVEDDVPSIHAGVRLGCGESIDLYCLHPRPPFLTTSESSTPRDAELLIVGRQIDNEHRPAIVLGDLNDVAWSRTTYLFQRISHLLDPRIGRGFYNTFNAKYPFLRFPLDHFFHSNHFKLVGFRRLEYFGSDHFPVFIELSYEPRSADQEEPRPDRGDRREAKREIKKAT